MTIAVVSTGLGHVQRGIEAWARSLAENLARDGTDVRLFHGGGTYGCPNTRLRFWRRGDWLTRLVTRLAPPTLWRGGWTCPYAFEQRSFAAALAPHLRAGRYECVHTQDVVLGAVLNGRVEAGRRGCPVILAHGTDETIETLKAFRYLQHLSPAHRDKAAEALGGMVMKDEADTDSKRRAEGPLHFCIPNFVDVDQFRPAGEGGADAKRAAWRRDHGIPEEALVVGCAAALKRSHKRLDVLIREVATLRTSSAPCFLLLAGASTAETPALKRTARERMGDRCMLVENAPFARMPEMYRAMDVFVLPATEEAFGICFLEAMACGVPVVAHASETSRWIVGAAGGGDAPGGWCVDMREAGFLERLWPRIETERGRKQRACRPHVVATFSWQAVRPAFLAMYAAVRRDASVPDIGSAPRVRGGGRYDR